MSRRALGVDVGGTYAKIALVDERGRALEERRVPTEPARGPADFVRRLRELTSDWSYDAVGFGVAGGVDAEAGQVVFAPNLPGWTGFSFRRALGGKSVVVENDANCAVWGAYCLALGRRARHAAGITLGTGVGGGLVLDGRLHRGATGSAGEIGHQTVVPGGASCRCGRRGCLEAYCGAVALARLARLRMPRPPSPLTPLELARAARAGRPGAAAVWRESGERLGQAIAGLCLVYNPEAVLLLGGVARAGGLLLSPVRRVLREQPFRRPFTGLRLLAPAGRDWGCLGAALLALERAGG